MFILTAIMAITDKGDQESVDKFVSATTSPTKETVPDVDPNTPAVPTGDAARVTPAQDETTSATIEAEVALFFHRPISFFLLVTKNDSLT